MLWRGGRQSGNIEDRRGISLGGGRLAGGGIGAVIIALIALYFGVDPSVILDGGQPAPGVDSGPVDSGSSAPPSGQDEAREFVAVVLADTEDAWGDIFRNAGRSYDPPVLVLFTGAVQSACGMAESAVGPFYCPRDRKVYLDLDFFRELSQRFRAPGEFAAAYVVAHEVGHHVQSLLGIGQQVSRQGAGAGQAERNALSVRQELQADCFAGIWANHADRTKHILEQGDVEAALDAASAIGDDRLQRQAQGYVVPESFTHGSSAQRVRWFKRGLEGGRVADCDTFAATSL
ncbi:MAG: neutral zinc metallopeptidase [Dongiaceae bacterium]